MSNHTNLFPNFTDETSQLFLNFNDIVDNLFTKFPKAEFYVAGIGAITNILHLIVISQKAMMMSSTNVILIGIVIHDLMLMLSILSPFVNRPRIGGCDPPPSLIRVHLELLSYAISDSSRRTSSWLGVSLAFVRFAVLKNARKLRPTNLGKLRFGWIIVFIMSFISILFAAAYRFRFKLIQFETWHPPPSCEFSENFTRPEYGYLQRAIFYDYHELLLKLSFLIDGILAKFVPCFILILLGFLLVKELKHAQGSRKMMRSKKESASKNRTTKIVICMTVSYLVAEFPLGLIMILQFVLAETPGFLLVLSKMQLLFNLINTCNATIHCFICFSLSVHYRNTVKRMLYCYKKRVAVVQAFSVQP
ncbi:Protein CBG04722 [Caenorhabditis briggsae]|uniref:Protein CBG04722 n=1 Tax=Caenorhabditis briggsae TaxID=6238 RepID=A8WYB3_CAEBR|nr:Protein CBG04722 [Caenorhabditis briggsae]CAP25371.2 Protein CBG04722 [Caenorhabditis briggsae]